MCHEIYSSLARSKGIPGYAVNWKQERKVMKLRQFQLNTSFWGRKCTEKFTLMEQERIGPYFPIFFFLN